MGLICYSFATGLRRRYFNKYFSWLLIWVFAVIIINFYIPFSLNFIKSGKALNIWTLEPMLHIIFAVWASYIALSYFEQDDFVKIARTLCFSAVAVSVIASLQYFGWDMFGKKVIFYDEGVRFSACLDNSNIAGAYLALCLPFFLIFKEHKYKLGFILVLAGVFISQSIMAKVCALLGLAVYFLLNLKNRKILIAALGTGIGAVLILLFNLKLFIGDFAGRLEVWAMTLQKFKENVIFGQGIGIFKTWNILHLGYWGNAHNDWLERLVELGLIGIILMVLVVINSIRKFNYKKDNIVGFSYFASFVSFLVLMGGSFPFEIAPLALLGLIGFWGTEVL
jgi:hypothetical protein